MIGIGVNPDTFFSSYYGITLILGILIPHPDSRMIKYD